MPQISRDMITIIQGLVILFAGALENMFRPAITAFFATLGGARSDKPLPAAE
jgi:simple sugar transport system permease protein